MTPLSPYDDPGAQCPPGLAKAADRIVEIDDPIDSPSNQQRLQAAIREVLG